MYRRSKQRQQHCSSRRRNTHGFGPGESEIMGKVRTQVMVYDVDKLFSGYPGRSRLFSRALARLRNNINAILSHHVLFVIWKIFYIGNRLTSVSVYRDPRDPCAPTRFNTSSVPHDCSVLYTFCVILYDVRLLYPPPPVLCFYLVSFISVCIICVLYFMYACVFFF